MTGAVISRLQKVLPSKVSRAQRVPLSVPIEVATRTTWPTTLGPALMGPSKVRLNLTVPSSRSRAERVPDSEPTNTAPSPTPGGVLRISPSSLFQTTVPWSFSRATMLVTTGMITMSVVDTRPGPGAPPAAHSHLVRLFVGGSVGMKPMPVEFPRPISQPSAGGSTSRTRRASLLLSSSSLGTTSIMRTQTARVPTSSAVHTP